LGTAGSVVEVKRIDEMKVRFDPMAHMGSKLIAFIMEGTAC